MMGDLLVARRTSFCAAKDNNYLLAGNLCNAFALGDIGSVEDFFLIGAEPPQESSYPLLTGNILDSEGQVLFRLVRNVLVINPGNCSKIVGNHIGYDIHDSLGNLIFGVRTRFETAPRMSEGSFVTTIAANFYDKNGRLVFQANSGQPHEQLTVNTKTILGFSGGFGFMSGMTDDECSVARAAFSTGGRIHQVLTGRIEGQEVKLDGKALIDAEIIHCKVVVVTGDFALIGTNNTIVDSSFEFVGPAENVKKLVMAIGR